MSASPGPPGKPGILLRGLPLPISLRSPNAASPQRRRRASLRSPSWLSSASACRLSLLRAVSTRRPGGARRPALLLPRSFKTRLRAVRRIPLTHPPGPKPRRPAQQMARLPMGLQVQAPAPRIRMPRLRMPRRAGARLQARARLRLPARLRELRVLRARVPQARVLRTRTLAADPPRLLRTS